MGYGKAFDSSRGFIFCANDIGPLYGIVSPVMINPSTGKEYDPKFPTRDDVLYLLFLKFESGDFCSVLSGYRRSCSITSGFHPSL